MRTLTWIAALATAGVMSASAQDLMTPTGPGQSPGVEANVEAMEARKAQEAGTIADVAMADPRFSTLVEAVKAAGLAETLADKGPYTVFAPTNEAFAAQPPAEVEAWMQPANKDKLAAVLQYHVVAGNIRAQDIPEGMTEVPTLQGGVLKIERKGDNITVNGATIAAADIMASNGTIHAIDQVMMPMPAATN